MPSMSYRYQNGEQSLPDSDASIDVRSIGGPDDVGGLRSHSRRRIARDFRKAERHSGRDASDQRIPSVARRQTVQIHTGGGVKEW